MAAAVTRSRLRWRQLLVLATAVIAITLAVLLGLLQLALPWWASDTGRVADLIARQIGAPVAIDTARPYWTVRGPLIELEGVHFGADQDGRIGQAALAIDLSGLVRSDRPLYEFRLHDLDLTLLRGDDDRWQLLGLPGLMAGGGGQPVTRMLRGLPSVALRDSRLHLRLAPEAESWTLHLPEIRRFSQGGVARWRGRLANPSGSGGELLLAMDSGSDDWARIHLRGEGLAMAQWLGGQAPAGIRLLDGDLALSAWLELDRGGIIDAQLQWRQGDSRWQSVAATDEMHDAPGSVVMDGRGQVDDPASAGASTDASVSAGTGPVQIELPPLSALARWQRDGDSGRLLVEQLHFGSAPEMGGSPETGAAGLITGLWHEGRVQLQASDIDLSPLLPLLALAQPVPDRARHWLLEAGARVPVQWARVDFDRAGLRQYQVRLASVDSQPVAPVPGLQLPAIDLAGDRQGLVLTPAPAALRLDFPGVFAKPLQAQVIAGGIAAWATADGWRIDSDGLHLAGVDYQGRVAGGIELRRQPAASPTDGNAAGRDGTSAAGRNASRLWLDLGVQASGQVLAANAFWPRNKIARTADWLERALAGGDLVSGRAWLRGPAGPFPFPDHSGHFEAVAEVADAGLDFHPDWPALDRIHATVLFENGSLQIDADQARIGGLEVAGASAGIDNLKEPILHARGRGRDSGEQLLAFLAQTPIQATIGRHLQGRSIQGRPQVAVELRLPLKRELGEPAVDGRIHFDGQSYRDSQHNLVLDDLNGELVFDRHGLAASNLELRLGGEPARLDLRIADATDDPAMALEARLAGRLSTAALLASLDWAAPLALRSPGRADWLVQLQVPEQANHDQAPTGRGSVPASATPAVTGRLQVSSDLVGISLQLPAPLQKDAGQALPLTLVLGTGADTGADIGTGAGTSAGRPLQLSLGDKVAMDLRLPAGILPGGAETAAAGDASATASHWLRGSVVLGAAHAGTVAASGIQIIGQTPALDLGGWLALGAGMGPGGIGAAGGWPQVDLDVGELTVFGRHLRQVELEVLPQNGQVQMRLAGPDAEGQVLWTSATGSEASVRARLERLHVSETDESAGSASQGGIDPALLPVLDVDIGSLRLGAIDLGRVQLQGQRQGRVYQISQFDTDSPLMALQAHGEWWRSRGEERSQFSILLQTEDLGAMLTGFGFQGAVDGGRTRAQIDGGWIGPPAAFALAAIDGTLTVDVGDGRIREVDPGVGRLFGLLNLREIPRRLMLDFRDFYGQGLRFSSIQGSFRLNTGNAFTDGIEVKSPSADILLTGRTGLAGRDYDQTVQVRPRVGGTFPVVGAIAGGPAGAAAGLVVQSLLRIDDASRIVYRVTGPWEEPVIVRQDPARSGAAAQPAGE